VVWEPDAIASLLVKVDPVEPPGPCDPVDPCPAEVLVDADNVLPVDGELPDTADVLLFEPVESLP
jgi:hypothetical protein